ncbi:CBS domain-containing protein [bacterium]|nr:CBS domain-containing protein [bacterium]
MADLKVRDIMTTDPVVVAPSATVTEAARLMVDKGIGALPVLEDGKLIGLVTEGDLIMQDVKLEFPTYLHLLDGFIMYPPATARFESELKKAVAADVRAVMTPDPVTVSADADVADAATLLVERDVSRLPVLDDGKLVGVVSKSDVVRSLLAGE